MKVKIKKLNSEIPTPVYHTPGSVGFDFSAVETVTIPPRGLAFISTGLIVCTPPGYMLLVTARSSTARKKGLMLSNGVGVVDRDYCGPEDVIKLSVYNFTDTAVTVEKGDRIAQGIFVRVDQAEFEETDAVGEKSRGGYGSTG